jgi:YNFM family putative membrane transporter
MGSFVTLFNYIGYRLMMSPWSLSQAVVGLLSVAYLTGPGVRRKRGHDRTLWPRPGDAGFTAVMLCGLLLTLFSSLWLIFIGMLLFSAGFFAAHSSPAAGLAHARAAPAARRHRCICSAIIWVPAWRGR